VLNAIFSRTRTGCQWRLLPTDFPAWYHVWYYERKWRDDAPWEPMIRVDQGYKSWLVECAKRWFGGIVDIVQRPTGQRECIVRGNAGRLNAPLGGWIGAASGFVLTRWVHSGCGHQAAKDRSFIWARDPSLWLSMKAVRGDLVRGFLAVVGEDRRHTGVISPAAPS